jgi:hypothetical protein
MLTLVRADSLGWVRPLLVPPRSRDGGEVVSFLYVVQLSLMKGEVMADPGLGVQPGSLSWASVVWVFARLMYRWSFSLLTNRCLEIPGDHNPDTYVVIVFIWMFQT